MARRTPTGDAATELVLLVFRANGLLLAAGDRLAAAEDLTSARWQVLGAVALEARPLTVPHIARRMGLTRQSVQASVDRLVADRLVETQANPDHRRSPLVALTEAGQASYRALERRQARWIDEVAGDFDERDLRAAAQVLERLSKRLERSDATA